MPIVLKVFFVFFLEDCVFLLELRLFPSKKGVQTGEDAILAAQHGVKGLILSNHGGRQADGCRSGLEILPEGLISFSSFSFWFPNKNLDFFSLQKSWLRFVQLVLKRKSRSGLMWN